MTTAGTEDAVGATVAAVHLVKRTCANLDTPQKSHSTKNRALTGSCGSWRLLGRWNWKAGGKWVLLSAGPGSREKRKHTQGELGCPASLTSSGEEAGPGVCGLERDIPTAGEVLSLLLSCQNKSCLQLPDSPQCLHATVLVR